MANTETLYREAATRIFNGDNSPMTNPLFNIGVDLLMEFEEAKRLRDAAEDRWLMDLRQYKGIYEPDVESAMRGSKSFLRKTRVKVESVDARLMDLLFPANRERNFSVDATPEPSVPSAVRNEIEKALTKAFQKQPTEQELKLAILEFVKDAAKKMGTRIDDQLAEARYRDVARQALHSGNLYGTGIIKGPLVERRTRTSYIYDDKTGGYKQSISSYAAPFIQFVPLWRFYPDMTVTELRDARYCWEHHRLSRAELVELASRKTFDGEAIKEYISSQPEGAIKLANYEQHLRTMGEQQHINSAHKTGQYDVYERWGWLTGDVLSSAGVDVPQERLHEAFFSNIWMFPDGRIIKAILSPIDGVDWPYHIYYFDKDETSIFGEGIASIMRDDQEMINAAARMILDNAAVTSGPQFEVFVPAFPPQADLTSIYPGKVWPRTDGDFQYPAIRQLQFNSHMNELSEILKLFDANADETLAIPKFTYGDNPGKGAAGTMGGLSMLLGQANIALKDLVVNYDEGITKPLITDIYHWNMKFSSDDSIKGDYEIVAKGASSLVAKEVRAQNLAQFVSTMQPEQRAIVKWNELTVQQAEVMDLAGIVMSEEEQKEMQNSQMAQQQQQMMQMQQQLQVALMQSQLAESQAKAAKADAEAMNNRIEAVYAAMQAAGVAATNPTVAPAGDAILRSAGWKDADQQPGTGSELAQGAQMPQDDATQQPMIPASTGVDPASPAMGAQGGIETQTIGD